MKINIFKNVGNLINFDVKSMYYEAKKIKIECDNFNIIPTFFEKIKIKKCTYFEICFDTEQKNLFFEENDKKDEENNENEEDENKQIKKILEAEQTTSFNVKICTFLNLNLNEN